jgi:hypothetical protein
VIARQLRERLITQIQQPSGRSNYFACPQFQINPAYINAASADLKDDCVSA